MELLANDWRENYSGSKGWKYDDISQKNNI